jgi:hypothetical protein
MLRRQTYLEKQEQKKNAMIAAGLVSERYPGVLSIAFQITYYQRTSVPVLMTRTVNFYPGNHASFHLDCMREECTNGGFDLAPVVAGLVKGRKRSARGNITCRGKDTALRHSHASISYEVKIEYARQEK